MERIRKVLRGIRDERGFTLVELLMVMVIIGVLAGIGFTGMGMLRTRTLVTKADTNWRVLDSAVQMYESSGKKFNEIQPNVATLTLTELVQAVFLDDKEKPWSEMGANNKWTDAKGCEEPDKSTAGTFYCIQKEPNKPAEVFVWEVEDGRIGKATHNPVPVAPVATP